MDFEIIIRGTSKLLMHNGRLSNPLDPSAKAMKRVSGKRNKTDEDHEEMARLEFLGALYYDGDIGPYIPADNIWRALYDAAKKSKRGPKVKEGVFVSSDVNPLAYTGPRDENALWADSNFRLMASVKVGTSRVMRCRPMFAEWSTSALGMLDESIIDLHELQQIAETAGLVIGLGDWRPRYGRFDAVVKAV